MAQLENTICLDTVCKSFLMRPQKRYYQLWGILIKQASQDDINKHNYLLYGKNFLICKQNRDKVMI